MGFGLQLIISLLLSFSVAQAIELERFVRIGQGHFEDRLPYEIRDTEIYSPKSVRFAANGRKIYINSLEGGKTVVYSWPELRKMKTISHRFTERDSRLFYGETTVFNYPYYTHSPTGNDNVFRGKPVESELSADGRYLWVPYYHRDWDYSSQSPGAVAIIDTRKDEIVRVMPTGPIPKYVVASPDGRYMAIIHWGDNTVALIDVSSGDPSRYQYVAHMVVEEKLDQSTMAGTDRDDTCGFCLRGSVFTPDSQYLIVARMGKGGIAGFHIPSRTYLGSVMNISSTPRHLVLSPDGRTIYASSNYSGHVSKIDLSTLVSGLISARGHRIRGPQWETNYVGKGARTLDISPSGETLFVALNESSELAAVDSQTLQTLDKVKVDPYAVGLAISPDGSAAIVTSQGHSGRGGNSVNIIRITNSRPSLLGLK